LHIIDISGQEERDPIEDYYTINNELAQYSQALAEKEQIIVLNKTDLPNVEENIKRVRDKLSGKGDIFEISAVTKTGITEVLYAALNQLKEMPNPVTFYDENEALKLSQKEIRDTINVYRHNEQYIADGYFLEKLVDSTNFEDTESIKNFQKVLNDKGVIEKLKTLGASEGDTVVVCGIEFDFIE
jgi:GTP-binding protein